METLQPRGEQMNPLTSITRNYPNLADGSIIGPAACFIKYYNSKILYWRFKSCTWTLENISQKNSFFHEWHPPSRLHNGLFGATFLMGISTQIELFKFKSSSCSSSSDSSTWERCQQKSCFFVDLLPQSCQGIRKYVQKLILKERRRCVLHLPLWLDLKSLFVLSLKFRLQIARPSG